MIHHRVSIRIQRELVFALESARTRLAVAIASETKSTPPDRWRYYLETADQARRFLKKLRKAGYDFRQEKKDWMRALESLRQLPVRGEALQLCRVLRAVVAELGAEPE